MMMLMMMMMMMLLLLLLLTKAADALAAALRTPCPRLRPSSRCPSSTAGKETNE
jgi:hypothetical protein